MKELLAILISFCGQYPSHPSCERVDFTMRDASRYVTMFYVDEKKQNQTRRERDVISDGVTYACDFY